MIQLFRQCIWLPAYPVVHLSIHISINLLVYLPSYPLVHSSIHLFIRTSTGLSHISTYLFTHSSTDLPIYSLVNWSIWIHGHHLFIYPLIDSSFFWSDYLYTIIDSLVYLPMISHPYTCLSSHSSLDLSDHLSVCPPIDPHTYHLSITCSSSHILTIPSVYRSSHLLIYLGTFKYYLSARPPKNTGCSNSGMPRTTLNCKTAPVGKRRTGDWELINTRIHIRRDGTLHSHQLSHRSSLGHASCLHSMRRSFKGWILLVEDTPNWHDGCLFWLDFFDSVMNHGSMISWSHPDQTERLPVYPKSTRTPWSVTCRYRPSEDPRHGWWSSFRLSTPWY